MSSVPLPLEEHALDDLHVDDMLEMMDLYVCLSAQMDEIAPYVLPFKLPLVIPAKHVRFFFAFFLHMLCV